jgi:hypothetical protein
MPVDTAIASPATLRIGKLELRGTPIPEADGTYATQRKARIVGGAGGWHRAVPGRGYHNDAGVKARLIADDLAREAGETIGTFVPSAERVGVDYAREAGVASQTLSDVIGAAAWWVDYDGITKVGPRPASIPSPQSYQILAYDPRERTASITTDDPGDVRVGATLSEGLAAPAIVRELEIVAGGTDKLRLHVWFGGEAQDAGRLATLLTIIARRALDGRLFGVHTYRVVSQAADDRLDLQAIDRSRGLPDLRAISLWTGVAGARSRVTPGTHVLVTFADGDRARPLAFGCAPFGGPGFVGKQVVIAGASGPYAARTGDAVRVVLPPATFAGTIGGATASGTVTWDPPAYADGTITKGSNLVQIAGTSTAPPADADPLPLEPLEPLEPAPGAPP